MDRHQHREVLSYGTSGFRYDHRILLRCGENIGRAIALLFVRREIERLRERIGEKDIVFLTELEVRGTWGLMVTASHNPPEDNGVKLVDSEGKMVRDDEEGFLVRVVNRDSDISDVLSEFLEPTAFADSDINLNSTNLQVIIAQDTRESGRQIIDILSSGMRQILPDIQIREIGYRTTPELHIATTQYVDPDRDHSDPNSHYVRHAIETIERYGVDLSKNAVDCANGVGGLTLKRIFTDGSDAPRMINNDRPECLNSGCGSDYVENNMDAFLNQLLETDVLRNLPHNKNDSISDRLFCSFDGDADRIVFYYFEMDEGSKNLRMRLMNGDHISALILRYVLNLLLDNDNKDDNEETINIGVIYTPYSDGNFVRYVENISNSASKQNNRIRVHQRSVPIGVKNLIRAAESYDIAIYFESNGHGSVIIDRDYGISGLRALRELFNQVIGDGIYNLIGVQYILQQMEWTPRDFFNMFSKCSSVMKKIEIDESIRSKFKMDHIDLVEPKFVIDRIKEIESRYENVRIYVRPSGTEPILRAYIEADRPEIVSEISSSVVDLIKLYEKEN